MNECLECFVGLWLSKELEISTIHWSREYVISKLIWRVMNSFFNGTPILFYDLSCVRD